MGRYILQRLIAAIATFFVILTLVFFVINAIPGDVLDSIIMIGGPNGVTQDTIEAVKAKYGFDKPLPVQYVRMLANYIRFDFGISLVVRVNQPVFDIIKTRLPITIQLNYLAVLVILPLGMFFGISMALRKNSVYDHAMSVVVIIFISMPQFVIAALLQYFLAFKFGWFPILLAPEANFNLVKLHSMILPVFAISFGSIATIARMLRAELSEVLTSDFMLLARAKGQTYAQTILRHALRNAIVPMTATFLYLFLGVLSSSLVIEYIFSVPGLSRLMIASLSTNDHQVTLAIVYFYTIIALIMSIIVDLSYGIIDPRIRMGGHKDE